MSAIVSMTYSDSISEETENDIEFYLHVIKPLILKLPHARDRAQAAAWIIKIEHDRRATEKVKTDYLKLLLMSLQRHRLVGIFTQDPQEFFELEGFPDKLDLQEYARKLLETEMRERRERIKRQLQGKIDIPPYYTDYSIDLREYVALQDIPGFGVHCYYAISKDPIELWNKSQNAIISKSTNEVLDTLEPPKRSSRLYMTYLGCECNKKCEKEGNRVQVKKRFKKWGLRPPIHPMGIFPPKEERKPPAWGSNLINVFDEPTEPETEEEILSLTTELKKLRQFLEEYETGTFSTSIPKTPTLITSTIKEVSEEETSSVERHVDDDSDEEESQLLVEIRENSLLTDYLKKKVRDTAVQHMIRNRNKEVQASTPGQAYIPVTTPKQSPIPTRRAVDLVSEACSTEALVRSVASYFNNDVESAKIDEELSKWVERLQQLEEECAALARQAQQKCSSNPIGSCGQSSSFVTKR